MSTIHTCDELGVCQSRGCPDCDAWECELPCSPEPARPTYPFAPGTIEGPHHPSTRHSLWTDLIWLLTCVGAIGMIAGYLVERFA